MALNNPQATGAVNPGTFIASNNFRREQYLTVTVTSDGTGNANNVNILIWPGITPSNAQVAGNKVDGTHIAITCPDLTSSAAEAADYMLRTRLHVSEFNVSTSDVANFSGNNRLTLGEVDADGFTSPSIILFDKYKIINGSSINDSFTVSNQSFVLGGNFFMKLKALKLSTSITFMFKVDANNNSAVLTSTGK